MISKWEYSLHGAIGILETWAMNGKNFEQSLGNEVSKAQDFARGLSIPTGLWSHLSSTPAPAKNCSFESPRLFA